jgi:hypothetical protein
MKVPRAGAAAAAKYISATGDAPRPSALPVASRVPSAGSMKSPSAAAALESTLECQFLTTEQSLAVIAKLNGDIHLSTPQHYRGQQQRHQINRLNFLKTLAEKLRAEGCQVEVYLVGSVINETIFEQGQAGDYDFVLKVKASSREQLDYKEIIQKALHHKFAVGSVEDAAKYFFGSTTFESANTGESIYLAQLGKNDTDIKIQSCLDYGLIDKAMAINLTDYLISENLNKIMLHYLEKKSDVLDALENKLIGVGHKSKATGDKLAACFKGFSEGKRFFNAGQALDFYKDLAATLLKSTPEIMDKGRSDLRYALYEKFNALNASQLLHGLIDMVVREPDFEAHLNSDEKKAFQVFQNHMTAWFKAKAQDEKKFAEIVDQIAEKDLKPFVENLQKLLLLQNYRQSSLCCIEGDEGCRTFYHLHATIHDQEIYCEMDLPMAAVLCIDAWSDPIRDELYDLSISLGFNYSANYFLDIKAYEASVAIKDQPIVKKSLSTGSPSASGKSWQVLGNELTLVDAQSIKFEGFGVPVGEVAIKWHGATLVLSDFQTECDEQGQLVKLSGQAQLTIANQPMFSTLTTRFSLTESGLDIATTNADLLGTAHYVGDVLIKKNRMGDLKSIIPFGQGCLQPDAKNDFWIKGKFFEKGTVEISAISKDEISVANLRLNWRHWITSPNMISATGSLRFGDLIFAGSFDIVKQNGFYQVDPSEGAVKIISSSTAENKMVDFKVDGRTAAGLEFMNVTVSDETATIKYKLDGAHGFSFSARIATPEIGGFIDVNCPAMSADDYSQFTVTFIEKILEKESFSSEGAITLKTTADAPEQKLNAKFTLRFPANETPRLELKQGTILLSEHELFFDVETKNYQLNVKKINDVVSYPSWEFVNYPCLSYWTDRVTFSAAVIDRYFVGNENALQLTIGDRDWSASKTGRFCIENGFISSYVMSLKAKNNFNERYYVMNFSGHLMDGQRLSDYTKEICIGGFFTKQPHGYHISFDSEIHQAIEKLSGSKFSVTHQLDTEDESSGSFLLEKIKYTAILSSTFQADIDHDQNCWRIKKLAGDLFFRPVEPRKIENGLLLPEFPLDFYVKDAKSSDVTLGRIKTNGKSDQLVLVMNLDVGRLNLLNVPAKISEKVMQYAGVEKNMKEEWDGLIKEKVMSHQSSVVAPDFTENVSNGISCSIIFSQKNTKFLMQVKLGSESKVWTLNIDKAKKFISNKNDSFQEELVEAFPEFFVAHDDLTYEYFYKLVSRAFVALSSLAQLQSDPMVQDLNKLLVNFPDVTPNLGLPGYVRVKPK